MTSLEPRTLYIDKTVHGRFFIAYREKPKAEIQFVFKNGSYEKTWGTVFGAKREARKIAERLDYEQIVVINRKS